jgi:HD-like signal output (HDOD) protein
MDLKNKILDIIRSKDAQIPTLPVIVDKILSLARSDRSSAQDLARIAQKHQAISSKFLRLSNAAYYGFMKEVQKLRMSGSVMDSFVDLLI